MKDYKNQPTIGRVALAICLVCAWAIAMVGLFPALAVHRAAGVAANIAACVMVVIGLYYVLFRRTGLSVNGETQQRLYKRLMENGSLAKKVAQVSIHDDWVRRTFGWAVLSGGLFWLLLSELFSIPDSVKLLFLAAVIASNSFLIVYLLRLERSMD